MNEKKMPPAANWGLERNMKIKNSYRNNHK